MQKETFRTRFQEAVLSGTWFEPTQIIRDSSLEVSERQILRWLKNLHGPVVHQLEAVRNANYAPLNKLLVSPLRSWLLEKRVQARIVQYLSEVACLVISDLRGHAKFIGIPELSTNAVIGAIEKLPGGLTLIPHGEIHRILQRYVYVGRHEILTAAHPVLAFSPQSTTNRNQPEKSHLQELERESIAIIRTAVARAKKPAMLFSMGKDSMVMLRLAQKAFAPEKLPFPLVVIDTQWKFQDMYQFRAWLESQPDLDFIIHINPDAIRDNVNPFDFGSSVHTDITKTQALKQVLQAHNFDFVFGGARRDEEKSRAKERIFSVRSENYQWDPKNQRPEFWDAYNTSLVGSQSMRVFPLSNWTELDVWNYIRNENIPLVPLYFSRRRAYVIRSNACISVDDERFQLAESEKVLFDFLRFRTLGCYPLTGGVASSASNVEEIIKELEDSNLSERSARIIDSDRGASMEQKKMEGYF
ncbi:MAG: hypothetical protein RIS51_492 [Actinomycetota bacterium]|jgi:sulfate adenylyltransferase subunit 2